MPYIEIKEQDNTEQIGTFDNTDVAYVPGFVCQDIAENKELFTDGEYTGIKPHRPELFTSLRQFESRCGKHGVVFTEDQKYSMLAQSSDGSMSGFSDAAVPFHNVMFDSGTVDPGYVMAKELLSAGIPVLFERMNEEESFGSPIKGAENKPENWDSTWQNYKVVTSSYDRINSPSVPTFNLVKADGTPLVMERQYFTMSVEQGQDSLGQTVVKKWNFTKVGSNSSIEVDISGIIHNKDGLVYYYFDTSAPKYYKFTKEGTISQGERELEPGFQQGKYMEDEKLGFVEITNSTWQAGVDYFKREDISDGNSDFFKKSGDNYSIDVKWGQAFQTSAYRIESEVLVDVSSSAYDNNATYREKLSGTTIVDMYNALANAFVISDSGLADKGNYDFKYITTGGYPVYEYNGNQIVSMMMNLAATRGDCVALIDHTYNPERNQNIDQVGNLYYTVKNDPQFTSDATSSYATMFTPWCRYNRLTTDSYANIDDRRSAPATIMMPASYAYLTSLANAIKTYANWLAIAGVARGTVLHLAQDGIITEIPNGVADEMSTEDSDGTHINPITNIRPYGEVIWGNRTLISVEGNGTKATSFLSIRNLVSDIKKLVYRSCRRRTFEPNNQVLWLNIKADLMPTLDRMKTGYGISDYQLAIDTANTHYGEHATLCFKIIISPVYPVERFYVTVVLQDNDVVIE